MKEETIEIMMERMQKIFKEREEEYEKRNEDYKKKEQQLQEIAAKIEKGNILNQSKEQELHDKEEKLKQKGKELDDREQEITEREQELTALSDQAKQVVVQRQMELEEIKTEKIRIQRERENLAHETVIAKSGYQIEDVKPSPEEYVLISKHLKEMEKKERTIEKLQTALEKERQEKEQAETAKANLMKRLLGEVKVQQEIRETPTLQQDVEIQQNFEEQRPDSNHEDKADTENESMEDITADSLIKFLRKTKEFDNIEKLHQLNNDIVKAEKNGLTYHFVLEDPPYFDVTAVRNDNRRLRKQLEEMNRLYSDTKFAYQDGTVIATTYYNPMRGLMGLSKNIERVAECFREDRK